MNFMGKSHWGFGVFVLLIGACGQDVSRSALEVTPSISPIVTEPGTVVLPPSPYGGRLGNSSFSVTVNRALIGIGSDETENHFALMRTLTGATSPGAYYGVGLGNKAQLGFGLDAASLKVSALDSVSFKVFEPSEAEDEDCSAHLSLNLLVDLNCDALNPNFRVITTSAFIPKNKDTWASFEVKATDARFKFIRAHGPERPLLTLLSGHPKACFTASDVFDLGMKRDQALAPLQLSVGDRYYFEPSSIRVDDVKLTLLGQSRVEDFEE